MYDAPGSDTKHEWIEIYTTENITVSEYKFLENGVYHGLVPFQGGENAQAQTYIVVADNPSVFLGDNPGFSGLLFDSSFSLKNEGEELSITDTDKNILFSVTYPFELGANGDGNTLQSIDGVWGVGAPTPGKSNTHTSFALEAAETEEETQSSTQTYENTGTTVQVQKITAHAGADRKVVSGSEVVFEGQGYGFQGERLSSARYTWNFGDGVYQEGKNVLHKYRHAGTYTAVLSVSAGEYTASDYVVVTVEHPQLQIAEVVSGNEGYIALENTSQFSVDITSWSIRSPGGVFVFPKGTLLGPKHRSVFSGYVLGPVVAHTTQIELLDSLGIVRGTYTPETQHALVSKQSAPLTQAPVPQKRVVEAEPERITLDSNEVLVEEEEEIESTTQATNSLQTASVVSGVTGQGSGGIVWFILLLIPLSVLPLYALYRVRGAEHTEAEEYEIIEEE